MTQLKPLTVRQLIRLLSKIPPDKPVYAWFDGERYPVYDVDAMDEYVDLNVEYRGPDVDALTALRDLVRELEDYVPPWDKAHPAMSRARSALARAGVSLSDGS